MPRFRTKPSVVEAVQYGPTFAQGLVRRIASFIADEELPDSEPIFLDYVRPAPTWAEDWAVMIEAGKDGAQGWVPVPLGHWIVRKPGDLTDHWPVDPAYFEEKYEPLDGAARG